MSDTPSAQRASGTTSAERASGTTSAARASGTTSAKRASGTTSAERASGTTSAERASGTTSAERASGTTSATRASGTTSAERASGKTSAERASGTTFTKRVFSGIKPSGGMTLGNYLGAMKRWVQMQGEDYETVFCVVDLHAITVWQDPAELRRSTHEVAAAMIASGIDPEKSILFNQSQVPAHAELAWLFNCVTRLGWMNRMTQFKDKAGKNAEKASLGLYAYPSLMAADILAYHATHVPVGEDQKQHVELTRDIAAKFNHDYGVDFFPLTEPVIEGPGMRVMSLRDGTKKMSKSGESDMERINMLDGADAIAKKFKKARTDPEPLPSEMAGLAERPEAKNLVDIYAALAEVSGEAVLSEFGGEGWGKFKPALAELAVEKLGPISGEMTRLMDAPDELDAILAKGAEKAEAVANPILERTFEIMGFVRGRR